ncbi:uncharacterized protein LOC117175236 [Belonocnema kinseyi]|uniref:uncharacterized protein LOC117175236 n=1 Tax=Belonocnema kinseyi TaxID=2817044 RepID=UPI00143CD8B8|nr:uncharacterized protein LOC117175236 [Belonocnema kinseyi]
MVVKMTSSVSDSAVKCRQDSSSILDVKEDGGTLKKIDETWKRKKKKETSGIRRFFERGWCKENINENGTELNSEGSEDQQCKYQQPRCSLIKKAENIVYG